MSIEDNKAVVRRFYEVMNEHRLDELSEFVAEDFVEETPTPGQEQGLGGLQRWLGQVFAAFPDMQTKVEEMVAEGETVAVRGFIEGTHQGALMGMESTGRRIRVEMWNAIRLRHGNISATRFHMDTGALMQQLGVTPDATAPA